MASDYCTCRSESRVNTETHGGGENSVQQGETRPDAHPPTRNRTAPQIKMHPGHSICVTLPSSPGFSVPGGIRLEDQKVSGQNLTVRSSLKPPHRRLRLVRFAAHSLRSRRERGAPTRTYPDQREQSWGSIYTRLPLGPQSKGLVAILHKRNR